MKPNNVHVAYLRRIEETLSMRARRHQLSKEMKASRAKDFTPAVLERMRNKHRACRLWEESHGVVL